MIDETAAESGQREIRYGLAAIGLFFGVFGGWAALAPLDAAVVAPGVVTVSGNRQTVQHRDGGVVSALNVREGQRVKKGDILIELAATELKAQEEALSAQAVEYLAQRARLRAESGGGPLQPPSAWTGLSPEDMPAAEAAFARHKKEMSARNANTQSKLGVLGQREQQLAARIAGYQEQIVSTQRQQELLQDELDGMNKLAEKGLVPMPRIRALERSLAELDGRKAELAASIEQAKEGIGESKFQGLSVKTERNEETVAELRQVDTRLAETLPQLAAVRAQLERTRLRAPVSGSVVGLTAFTVGGVVRPGERVLDIVPNERNLVIEAKVPPQGADDIREGLPAQVRITAFHGRDLPIVKGIVREISADRFEDERTGQSYFRTEVEVSPEELQRLVKADKEHERHLRAGLPAEVIIPTRRRTALTYLTEPLGYSMRRAFRED